MVKSMGDDLNKLAGELIQTVVKRLNDGKSSNTDWCKTVNLTISDIDETYALKYAMDGSVTCEKKSADDAIVTLILEVDTLKKVLSGDLNGAEAYHSGLFQVEGDLMSLMRLNAAFGGG
jgi:putative sterol carrier protein